MSFAFGRRSGKMDGLICWRAVEFGVGENADDGCDVSAEEAEDKSGDE